MNKKVLTLCAGFLLAGGLNAFAESFPIGSSMVTGTDFSSGGDYYLVNTINGVNYAYGFEADPNDPNVVIEKVTAITDTNLERDEYKDYVWTVTENELTGVGVTPVLYGYTLVNKATGKTLIFDSTGAVDTDYSDNPATLDDKSTFFFFASAAQYKTMTASALAYDGYQYQISSTPAELVLFSASGLERKGTFSGTSTFSFYSVEDKTVGIDELNDLYNSTGFNLKLNDDEYKDVANIFADQRIKAIKVGRGVNLTDPVTSPVASETDYGFPAGTYFVVSTPAGAYPENASGNVGAQYEYLQQCTFIAVNPVENDINGKAEREAGKGFQLTTVLGSDMNKYLGADKQKQPKGRQISVSNACFEVSKDVNDDYAIVVNKFWFNKAKADAIKDTDAQESKEDYNITVTKKGGEDNDNVFYLTTDAGTAKSFIFEMQEVFTQKALDWLNTNGMAAYNVQFVNTEDEVAEDMYLYCPAYGNKAYAKGAKFVDLNAPETQFVITDVNTDDNSLTFTNRANHNQSITVKLYEETDGVYSIAVDPDDQANDDFTVISVDNNGNLNEGEELSIHGQWAKITPATVDKFAGAWDVDDETEVTMLFARDNTPTSNKLYVHRTVDNNGKYTDNLNVSNKLSDALQFRLCKEKDPKYITNIYAYKSGDQVLYKSQGDTIAYYTYKFQAYKDGVAIDKWLVWGTPTANQYGLTSNENGAGDFIIKDNVDGSVSIVTSGKYDHTQFVAVKGWKEVKQTIGDFDEDPIQSGELSDANVMQANYVKTYLNIESPEVTLDPKSSYVTMKSDMGVYITMQEDSRDAIVVSNEPMTIRLFVTDADRQVPNFLVATGYDNASKERMFLFNPTDSVNYLVAEGDYDKEYQWGEGLNKAIFKKAYLNEAEAAHDTLFTEIKGKNVAVSNDADNNKNVQGGLDKFKFQIILAEDEDNLYWIRQNGEYLTSVNGKLAFSGDLLYRPQALKVEVEATDMPTANEGINAADEAVKVVATNGAVIVKGAEGKNVVVSTILGKVVANEVLNSDNETIAAPAGIVVVSVDGESFKVAVK